MEQTEHQTTSASTASFDVEAELRIVALKFAKRHSALTAFGVTVPLGLLLGCAFGLLLKIGPPRYGWDGFGWLIVFTPAAIFSFCLLVATWIGMRGTTQRKFLSISREQSLGADHEHQLVWETALAQTRNKSGLLWVILPMVGLTVGFVWTFLFIAALG